MVPLVTFLVAIANGACAVYIAGLAPVSSSAARRIANTQP